MDWEPVFKAIDRIRATTVHCPAAPPGWSGPIEYVDDEGNCYCLYTRGNEQIIKPCNP